MVSPCAKSPYILKSEVEMLRKGNNQRFGVLCNLADEPDIFAVVITYVTAAVNVVYSFKKKRV
jgi:NADPH-dependent 7-cyano-7-deazaguanine reductase QueF